MIRISRSNHSKPLYCFPSCASTIPLCLISGLALLLTLRFLHLRSHPPPQIHLFQSQAALPQNFAGDQTTLPRESTSRHIFAAYQPYGNRCASVGVQERDHRGALLGDGFKYYLSAVIANRVFKEDLFHVTTYDIKQWIEYMFYAGLDHIYWYDTAHNDTESQELYLAVYVKMGLLTYHRFHHLYPNSMIYGYHFEQDNTYGHFLQNYREETKWVAELDVDEYPFSPVDRNSCFLRRFLHEEYEQKRPKVSQVLMRSLFFFGNPIGDLEDGWLIEKYQRRKHETEQQGREKPILRANLSWIGTPTNPHRFMMTEGGTVVAKDESLRMNHYWGSRITDFGPDTREVMEMVEPDTSIQSIADELKKATGLTKKEYAFLTK